MKISIANDFSRYPAGRYREDGDFSGQRFREEMLVPKLNDLGESGQLEVTFDGVEGLGSSFLEEAFGGLVRVAGMDKSFLDAHLKIFTDEEELRDFVRLTWNHIENAANARQ